MKNIKIRAIKRIANNSKRYDIQTDNCNFFASNILVHNSLIKVWHHNAKWHVSTNGMIDANKAELTLPTEKYKTFGDLFSEVFHDFQTLNENYTYMFEIIGPYNRVVIPYSRIEIYHIGARETRSGKELITSISVQKPKEFDLRTLEDIVSAAKVLPFNDEGYVAVDANWNRVKIKSPAYVAVHHLRGEGQLSYKRVLTLIISNENTEYLNYFNEYKNIFDEVEKKYNEYKLKLEVSAIESLNYKSLPRREYAAWATKQIDPGFLFSLLDGKINSSEQHLAEMSSEKLAKKLGY